jgi:hypothetical protein
MIGRQQLAVASPISIAAVAGATVRAFGSPAALADRNRESIASVFGTRDVRFTDSGTSALLLALRMVIPKGGTVGFPGYACVDLTAAALAAGIRVRLYDLDPSTLSPNLDSVEQMLKRGVDAIVVAHLYGYPADVVGVRALASKSGAVVIEDAAQGAGGRLDGKRLGSLGDLSVLSFGRGKGLCAGGGGALLAFDDRWRALLREVSLPASGRGLGGLAKTGAQWTLGRPSLYAIPSMIPWLRLGEMVYHPAGDPVSMSTGSHALLESALALDPAALLVRKSNAAAIERAAGRPFRLEIPRSIPGGESGFLRFAVRDLSGGREPQPHLGVLRSYPSTLSEQAELAPILIPGESVVPGALEIRRSIFTAPTHRFVSDADVVAIGRWMGAQEATRELELKRAQEQNLDVTRANLPR